MRDGGEQDESISYVNLARAEDGHILRELQKELPASVANQLRATVTPDERVLLSFPVDMNLLGRYAQEWFVLTNRQCATWAENEDGFERNAAFYLESLRGARLRELTGNHILLVDTGRGWEELVRSTNMTAWKLKPAVQVLQAVAANGVGVLQEPEQLDLKLPERPICPKCGRIIRPRLGMCVACLNKRRVLARMLGLLKPHKLRVVLVLGLLFGMVVLDLLQPQVQRAIIDVVLVPAVGGVAPQNSFWYRFGPPASGPLLLALGAALLVLILVPTAMGAVHRYLSTWLGQRIVVDLSNRVFAHMMRLSLQFYQREETGRAMARITQDVGRIREFVAWRLQNLLQNLLTIVLISILMVQMNWKLALLLLLPLPVMALVTELARRKLHNVYHVLWRRYAAVSGFLADTIPGIRIVKAFAQGPREARRFSGIMNRVFDYEMRATKVRTTLEPILALSTRIGGLVVFAIGGIMVLRGRGQPGALSVGVLIAFSQYMWRFYGPVTGLAHLLPEFEHAATSADRVFDVLDSEPELQSPDRTIVMPQIKGRVEFQNVTFGYEPDEPVLKDVSFVVEPGEMIGLVGHSGAGKTTVINLVCHFYKVDEGKVLVDGIDLAKVDIESLRRQIGIVPQEPFLFSGTIAENIAYGKPDASEREIIAAAKAANVHDAIMRLPEGYDTLVGERGLRISGGERQRLAIARAILKNPRILILDEATSSVDTESEEKIQEALRRLVAGRTTFAIAHRLSTLKYANRLLVLDHGRLVESGTHDELLALNGVYARLCQKQTELSRITAWQE